MGNISDTHNAKVNIPVKTWTFEPNGNTQYFAECAGYTAASYKNDKSAREELSKMVVDAATKHSTCEKNNRSTLVQCVDGTVIICSFVPYLMTYQHSIVGLDRERASYATSPKWNKLEDCEQSAREHAGGSYGGVLREYRF